MKAVYFIYFDLRGASYEYLLDNYGRPFSTHRSYVYLNKKKQRKMHKLSERRKHVDIAFYHVQ